MRRIIAPHYEYRRIPSFPYHWASSAGHILHTAAGGGIGFRLRYCVVNGYFRCCLDAKHRLVHRLIAETFIGPCPVGKQVNHINGIKSDNRPVNIEYVTPEENIRHAQRLGLRKTKMVCRTVGAASTKS